MNSENLLIFVIVFFLLGCRVSCGNLSEGFAWTGGSCTCDNYKKCMETSGCTKSDAQGAGCNNKQIKAFDLKLKTPKKCASTAKLASYANVRGTARKYNPNNFQAYRPSLPTTRNVPVQIVRTQCPPCPVCPACNSCCPTQKVVVQRQVQARRPVYAANTGSYQVNRNTGNAFGNNVQDTTCNFPGVPAVCHNPICCGRPKCAGVQLPGKSKCTR